MLEQFYLRIVVLAFYNHPQLHPLIDPLMIYQVFYQQTSSDQCCVLALDPVCFLHSLYVACKTTNQSSHGGF